MADSAVQTGPLTLVLGGISSGKSRFAERLAGESARVLYVAAAQAFDAEMAARIAAHRATRPANWRTVEAPTGLARAIAGAWRGEPVVLVEDLGTLLANLLLSVTVDDDDAEFARGAAGVEAALVADVAELLAWQRRTAGVSLIVVSAEVGLGLVPPNRLGRAFAEQLGRQNQFLARAADRGYLVVAGRAIDLTALGVPVD